MGGVVMLTEVVIDGVEPFKKKTSLETSKKVNLIYGLNGTGKSTVCRFLRDSERAGYEKCQLQKSDDIKIFVFNDEFIEEVFYQSEDIKGIFSLSKENKEAEEKIAELTKDKARKIEERQQKEDAYRQQEIKHNNELGKVVDKIFSIKRDFSGGDRVLEFCLEGVMAKKEKLVERLLHIQKPIEKPKDTISELQDEARLLERANAGKSEQTLPRVNLDLSVYEEDKLLHKAVVGTHNSTFADFITNLQMSDWVKRGLSYVDAKLDEPGTCPFCQSKTIDSHVLDELNAYFDQEFEKQISKIEELSKAYDSEAQTMAPLSVYEGSSYFDSRIPALYARLEAELAGNSNLLKQKVASPSIAVELTKTKNTVDALNEIISQTNKRIDLHNDKISNIGKSRKQIVDRFWTLMRWEYDQSATFYGEIRSRQAKLDSAHRSEIDHIEKIIGELNDRLSEAQRQTVNVDEAVTNINSRLLDVGVTDFRIKKHSDHLYRLERIPSGENSFKSLSEGEKMIVALLYFCELCAGKASPDDVSSTKIAVFDDPVSSMSHVYVFNVGRILISRFFRTDLVAQVFVFTHSLYFFYELTDTDHERREDTQALFRVSKNKEGSSVSKMRYEEVQNDYQAYWEIINDSEQHPAVITNCMRNVIEYFFGFVEKQSFNNVFQKKELQANRFQAFSRYMNRESHSIGQNVFDFKEFDYETFKDGLRLVFDASGYGQHYKKMARIGI